MPYRRRPSEEAQTSSHPHARAAEKRRPSPHVAFAARIFLRKINRGPSIAYQTARGRPSRMFIREEGSQVDQGPGGQESAGGIERPRVTESITKCAVTLTRGATGWSDESVHDSGFVWKVYRPDARPAGASAVSRQEACTVTCPARHARVAGNGGPRRDPAYLRTSASCSTSSPTTTGTRDALAKINVRTGQGTGID